MEKELVVGRTINAKFEDVGCGVGVRNMGLRGLERVYILKEGKN